MFVCLNIHILDVFLMAINFKRKLGKSAQDLQICKVPHYFKKTKDVHVYDTRGKSELYVCVQNLPISRQNPLSCCPKLYNLLPVSIRAEHIFSRFETALKTFVRQRKFYTFEEYSDYMINL